MADQILERQLSVGARPELSVNNIAGRIEVRSGDGSTINVRAVKHGSSRAVENTRIDVRHEGNHVRIETKGDKGGLLNLTRSVSAVDYDIVVPRDCEIHAHGVSADVIVRGVSATIQVQTVSGDIQLSGISGDCQLTTVSGDITGDHLVGALTLRTTSGDAKIVDSELAHFNLNSVSGDFWIASALAHGQHYLVKTISGDFRLVIPEGTGAFVQMRSVSGDVQSDIPAEIIKSGRRNWQGRINDGGAHVELHSVSGDLRISQSDQSSSLHPQPSEARTSESSWNAEWLQAHSNPSDGDMSVDESAAATTNTNEVLKALERGEISVEEAMERLETPR